MSERIYREALSAALGSSKFLLSSVGHIPVKNRFHPTQMYNTYFLKNRLLTLYNESGL